jgi:hypothetical protein
VAPELLLTLLSKPRPHFLVRDISETNALNLKKMLNAQGMILEFVPSTGKDWQEDPMPAAAVPEHRETRARATILIPPPPPPTTPPAVAGQPILRQT